MKLYIAILDEFPDYMVPTLVGHAVLGYHLIFADYPEWKKYIAESFKKVTVRVNQKQFDKIAMLDKTYLFHENNTLGGKKSCAVTLVNDDVPNVLKYATLWKPKFK